MSRTRLNLLLAVVVLALAGGAWFAKRKSDTPKPTLTGLAAEGVDRITVEWPGSRTIKLEKQGAEWRLTEPVQVRADPFEAVGATSLASSEVAASVEGDDVDLKELGLAPPGHVVTLNDVRVEFGGSDPLQSRRYVRVGGAIKLIEDPATAALDKDFADLVSKELFAPGEKLAKIELPGLTLSVDAKGNWTAPAGTVNATPQSLKTLADGWLSAKAMWNEAAPGPAPEGETVRITDGAGKVSEFVVAATDPQLALYSPRAQVRHQLSKALADTLLKLPAETAPAPATPP